MKHLKMLGLAAIAALGLMAFVGAGTASATTLSTDAAGTIKYPAGTEIHYTLKPGTSTALEASGGTVIATCTESTAKGSIKTSTGTWVGGALSGLNWGGCSQTTDTLTAGGLEVMHTVGDAGTIVETSSAVTFGVFGVSCVYGTGEGTTVGTITGGTAPELSVGATIAKISGGFLCPSTVFWSASYIVTTPHALHIVE